MCLYMYVFVCVCAAFVYVYGTDLCDVFFYVSIQHSLLLCTLPIKIHKDLSDSTRFSELRINAAILLRNCLNNFYVCAQHLCFSLGFFFIIVFILFLFYNFQLFPAFLVHILKLSCYLLSMQMPYKINQIQT